MTTEDILVVYFAISAVFMFTSGIWIFTNESDIEEIDNIYDWFFYGIFWILILLKYMIKFFYKLFTT